MTNPLPAMPWNPCGGYDCTACEGESRRQDTDCPECGGTGWAPPMRPYDEVCGDCRRPLWLGGRGPQWFEHDANGEIRCRFCLTRAVKKRKISALGCGIDHRDVRGTITGRFTFTPDDQLDLAAFVDKGKS